MLEETISNIKEVSFFWATICSDNKGTTKTPAEGESSASSDSEETGEPEAELNQEKAKVDAEKYINWECEPIGGPGELMGKRRNRTEDDKYHDNITAPEYWVYYNNTDSYQVLFYYFYPTCVYKHFLIYDLVLPQTMISYHY